jgi:hypothetical protein
MILTILVALISASREAQADESVMISFGPYSPECVEQVFSEFGHEFIGNSSTHASLVPRRRDKGKPAAKRGRKAYGPPKARWGEEVARLSNGVGGGATKRSAIPTVSSKQEAGHSSPTQAKRLDTPATVATM